MEIYGKSLIFVVFILLILSIVQTLINRNSKNTNANEVAAQAKQAQAEQAQAKQSVNTNTNEVAVVKENFVDKIFNTVITKLDPYEGDSSTIIIVKGAGLNNVGKVLFNGVECAILENRADDKIEIIPPTLSELGFNISDVRKVMKEKNEGLKVKIQLARRDQETNLIAGNSPDDTTNIVEVPGLFFYYIDEKNILKINAFKKFDFFKIHNVNLLLIINKFIPSLKELYKIFNYKYPKDLERLMFSDCSKNLAYFSYLSAFFCKCKKNNKNIEVLTSGAFLHSNAAINEGICVNYFLHGLIGEISPLVHPLADKIYVYSYEEKKYLKNLRIKSKIYVYPYKNIKSHNNAVIFFMRQSDKNMNEKMIIEILKVFKKYDYKIYIKTHPTYTGNVAYRLAKLFNIQMIENRIYDAISIIKEKKPRFVVSWFGTAICESLNSGVIPITLAKSYEMENLSKDFNKDPQIVYPIFKRSISWHKEKNLFYELLNSTSKYLDILNILKQR